MSIRPLSAHNDAKTYTFFVLYKNIEALKLVRNFSKNYEELKIVLEITFLGLNFSSNRHDFSIFLSKIYASFISRTNIHARFQPSLPVGFISKVVHYYRPLAKIRRNIDAYRAGDVTFSRSIYSNISNLISYHHSINQKYNSKRI